MRWIVLVALVGSGCNQVFDLKATTPAPPADAIDAVLDSDGDGVIDLNDNCRMVANPSQHDEDHDGVGDVCDNCPLVENNGQADTGEGVPDGVGDACDPHPTDPGDCLVLLDTFADPAAFATHWQLYSQVGDTPVLDPEPDFVRIVPNPNFAGGFIARDDTGNPLLGTFSVQMLGSAMFPTTMTELAVVSNARAGEPLSSGFLCGLQIGRLVILSVDGTGPAATMSASSVGSQLLLRLVAPVKAMGPITCRADYGLAVGVATTVSNNYVPGFVGVVAENAPEVVGAIALYDISPTCAPPTYR